jgi:hypothetical protein
MAGGNQPLISTIALGRESGTTRFTVNTLMVPDNLVVVHGQDILASTGCVGTEQITNDVCAIFYTQGGAPTFVAPDFPGCNPNTTGELVPGCWCCKGGTCYTDIRYNGGPNMTVAVEPNCAGHPNTAWSFQLSCQSP